MIIDVINILTVLLIQTIMETVVVIMETIDISFMTKKGRYQTLT